jgi:RNA polymerase sigma-70 factor, ECF subfamily
VSRGDARAREELIQAWGPVVLRWCARLGGPGVDAEDAAHDAFVVVLECLSDLRDPQAFPAWLYRVTRSAVARRRRSAWFRRVVLGEEYNSADGLDGPEALAERRDEIRVTREILDELPRDLREILVLCEIESRSEAEVAALIGIPPGTVKSRLHRAREAFGRRARRRSTAFGRVDRVKQEGSP